MDLPVGVDKVAKLAELEKTLMDVVYQVSFEVWSIILLSCSSTYI